MNDARDNIETGRDPAATRKPYTAPAIAPLGRLRDVTATGSATANEPNSGGGQGGNPNTRKRRP